MGYNNSITEEQMKLTDLRTGTYAAVRVLDPTNKELNKFIKHSNIPSSSNSKERRKHVTLLYSRTHLPNFKPDPSLIHIGRFQAFELFDMKPNQPDSAKCLVMKISCPTLSARFTTLMSLHPATYDFPTYQPHITLSYNIPRNFDVGTLVPFAGDIILGEEYSEDLII